MADRNVSMREIALTKFKKKRKIKLILILIEFQFVRLM